MTNTVTVTTVHLRESMERILREVFPDKPEILEHARVLAERLADEVEPSDKASSLLKIGDREVGVTFTTARAKELLAQHLEDRFLESIANDPGLLNRLRNRIEDL